MKKILSILLACAMVFSSLFGCSKGESQDTNTDKTGTVAETGKDKHVYLNLDSDIPVVKQGENISLKFAVLHSADFGKVEDLYFWNFVKKKMNIDAKVEQIFNRDEYVQLAFASDSLPDVMIGMNIDPIMQMNYGVQEKQIMPLTKYVNKTYMPNLQKIYDDHPEYKAMMTAPDGNIYSFGFFWDPTNPSLYPKRQINVKWLKEANLEMPKTLDELINVLRTFKKRGKDIVPLGGSFNTDNPYHIILSALGYLTNVSSTKAAAVRNGQAVIPAGDREVFGEFLKLMNQFYNEGLISKDFFTLDQTSTRALVAEGKVGLMAQDAFISLPKPEGFQQYLTTKALTSKYCEKPVIVTNSTCSTGGFIISSNCKYPEAAIRFANYTYSDVGSNLTWVGAVRGSENILDGWGGWYLDENYSRTDVDRVNNPGKWPNAVEYLRKRVAGFNMGAIGSAINENTWRPEANGLKPRPMREVYAASPENGDLWFRTSVLDNLEPYNVPGYPAIVYFSKKENDRITELKAVIDAHIDSECAKFITGARPLSEINAYFDELDKLGFQEYLGFYKTAYKNYQNNLKK